MNRTLQSGSVLHNNIFLLNFSSFESRLLTFNCIGVIYNVTEILATDLQKLLKTLERFRNKVRDNRGALAFVVIMSSVGFDSGFGILTADCEEVDHEDIMCGFDEPGRLAGVPKVFLFNTCVSSWTPEFSFHEGLLLHYITLHYWLHVQLTRKTPMATLLQVGTKNTGSFRPKNLENVSCGTVLDTRCYRILSSGTKSQEGSFRT